MNEKPDTLDVWVLDFADRSERARAILMETFEIDAPTAEKVLASAPAVVKRRVPPRIARRFQAALERAGARVAVVPLGGRPDLGGGATESDSLRPPLPNPPSSVPRDAFATVVDRRVPRHAREVTEPLGEIATSDPFDTMPLPSLDDGDLSDPFAVGAPAPPSIPESAPVRFDVNSVRPIEARPIAQAPSHAPAAPVPSDARKDHAGNPLVSLLARIGRRLLFRFALAITLTVGGLVFIWLRGVGDSALEGTDAIATEELGGKAIMHIEARAYLDRWHGLIAGLPSLSYGRTFVSELYQAGAETVYATRIQWINGVGSLSGTLVIELPLDGRDQTRARIATMMNRFVDTPERAAPHLEVGEVYLRIVFVTPEELQRRIDEHLRR